ncbi:ABC transporter permease [Scrofimicrobium sp. R131]|uniref:Iron chelate uptake ABC transporter family permease subunit n=1 Tax=Scrofimicrobium appendicitidis TaxID=3079930 RepID=A0AAU7V8J7_9ACTO
MTTIARPQVRLAPPRPARLRHWPLLVATLAVAGLVVASLFVGVYDLSQGALGQEMFWITRVPRTAALILAGSAMAVSGLLMQMITQNRFAEPTTTGTAEWAGLGLLVVTIVAPAASLPVKMLVASIAALVGTTVFLLILRRVQLRTSLVVPLIGIMLGAVVSAFTTYLAVTTNLLQMLGTWFQGSFTGVVRGRYEVLWLVALVVVVIYVAADRFTIAGLGQDLATSVGLNYQRTVFLGASLVAVATGVTTVVVGFLPFLGLIVPNVVSLLRGDNLRSNLPWVCLGGVGLVTAADLLGRTVRMPFEIPVAVILGIVGSIVFIGLLLRQVPRD